MTFQEISTYIYTHAKSPHYFCVIIHNGWLKLEAWVAARTRTATHAAIVIHPGRVFLHELFSLASIPHYHTRLNSTARADIQWWQCFLQGWNGVSVIPPRTPSIHVYSDTLGSFGCGAFIDDCSWLQLRWPPSWQDYGIADKEMVPVVVTAATWGHRWHGTHVAFYMDNMAVVAVLQRQAPKDKLLMHMLLLPMNSHQPTSQAVRTLRQTHCRVTIYPFSPLCSLRFIHSSSLGGQGAAPALPTGLELSDLDQTVHGHFHAGLASTTAALYRSGLRKYLTFCAHFNLNPFPLSEQNLLLCGLPLC